MGMRPVLPLIARACLLACLLAGSGAALRGQQPLPLDRLAPGDRAQVQDILARANFDFTSRTEPRRVGLGTMEKLFDHPRMSVAMWRQCQFVPPFYAQVSGPDRWSLDDLRGLRAELHQVYARPGWRIYLVDGHADRGWRGTPVAVTARMVASYRYWEGPKGYESEVHTWTALDSALLSFMARPFYGVIHARQEEFIAYINSNIAVFGEAAELSPSDFLPRLRQEGDPEALKEYQRLFGGRP